MMNVMDVGWTEVRWKPTTDNMTSSLFWICVNVYSLTTEIDTKCKMCQLDVLIPPPSLRSTSLLSAALIT
jgi:hypothetical protein